jgi:uncharacterized protein (DUF433 family)
MICGTDKLLGIGLYTPREAAFYARLHTRTLNRWLYGDSQGEPVIEPERGRDDKSVSFLDFVQTLAIRAITQMPKPHRVSLRKVREAVDEAKKRYNVDYPFAMEHTTYLFGNDVIIRRRDDGYVQLTGHAKGNWMLSEVVELYMKRLDYDALGIACKYTAWGEGDSLIVMNPQARFGEPMFPKYGYTASTLWEAVLSEGSVRAAAKTYGVPEDAVEAACGYFDHLQGAA